MRSNVAYASIVTPMVEPMVVPEVISMVVTRDYMEIITDIMPESEMTEVTLEWTSAIEQIVTMTTELSSLGC